MLKVENLNYFYEEGKYLFENISVNFENNKSYLLTGKSGCGKSTLGYLLSGLVKTDDYIIMYDDCNIDSSLCSMMFQNPSIQFCMDTVFNELIFILENMNIKPEEMESEIDKALSFVEMSDFKYRELKTLSGGEKQRISLASIYLLDRKVLILDEPFASLDEDSSKFILNKIFSLKKERNFTLIIIDHLLELYFENIDHYYIVENKSLNEITYKELTEKLYYGEVLKVNDKINDLVLEIKNLNIYFGTKYVVKDFNLNIKRNDILCLSGNSGSGKSTVLNSIINLIEYNGEILLFGKNIKKNFSKVGFLFQNPMDQFIYPRVYDEIYMTCRDEALTKSLLEEMNLWEYRELSPFKLSQGQQRRLALAIIFSIKHDLLVLDEPTYGQDRINAIKIMNMIVRYINKYNSATIFTSHDKFIVKNYSTNIKDVKNEFK